MNLGAPWVEMGACCGVSLYKHDAVGSCFLWPMGNWSEVEVFIEISYELLSADTANRGHVTPQSLLLAYNSLT